VKALVLPAPVVVELPDDTRGRLKMLQELVGGNIEAVLMPDGVDGYGNDEAKLSEHMLNPLANALWRKALNQYGAMRIDGDYIAGTVVVVGRDVDEGENTDVPDEFVAQFRREPL
jgi:hypothetical protein